MTGCDGFRQGWTFTGCLCSKGQDIQQSCPYTRLFDACRSLLALAECINALGKARKKGLVFVPFRNSKLTRLLKDGLCGK